MVLNKRLIRLCAFFGLSFLVFSGCQKASDETLNDLKSMRLSGLSFREQPAVEILDAVHKVGNYELTRRGSKFGFSLVVCSCRANAFRSVDIDDLSIFDAIVKIADAIECDVEYDGCFKVVDRGSRNQEEVMRSLEGEMNNAFILPVTYFEEDATNVVRDVWRKANAILERKCNATIGLVLPNTDGLKKISVDIPSTNLLSAFECVANAMAMSVEYGGSSVWFSEQRSIKSE